MPTPVELYETRRELVLLVRAAGLTPNGLHATVEDGVLEIHVQKAVPDDEHHHIPGFHPESTPV